MKTYRQASRTPNLVRYSDPLAFFNDVTMKAAVQPKKAGSVTVYNAASAINISRTVDLPKPVGCTDKCAPLNQEKLALRFSLSGSTQSKAEVLTMVADFKLLLDLYVDDLSSGYVPESISISVGA